MILTGLGYLAALVLAVTVATGLAGLVFACSDDPEDFG